MPRTTAKRRRKPNTRSAKNEEAAENQNEKSTLKTKLSEPETPKKRQRKANNKNDASEESARTSPASDNVTDTDYIQANNTRLTSEEAIQQPKARDDINNKPENNQIQPQLQKQPLVHVDSANNIPFANPNQQMYYFLELPYANECGVGPPIDSLTDSPNESLKHNRSLHLNHTPYKNDSLCSAKTYLIANPLCVSCSANPLYLNLQSQQTQVLHSPDNHSKNTDSQELTFPNQAALVEWLRTRQDLLFQAQGSYVLSFLCRILLFDPTDDDVKKFVGDGVWKQKLNRFLDASDYCEFQKSTSLKSLKTFVIESLKIHIAYLIAIRNQKKPSYHEEVLHKIKLLDRLTAHMTIPAANGYNYANELDLNMKSDNNDG
ncbi:9798_t:CDS:2 [Racocetra fulgida]|uniref:9798_t:CDS:1 n=1 Tax=Racocetra fulgida TaxID=60492 RepID=A0A9N8Z4C2_9GLOM|nr:9798_t:CDS:2 [Racocetra fulgida]